MGADAAGQESDEIGALGRFERARLTWRLLRDPRVPIWMKAALPTVAAIYVIVPIDLIPDFLIGVGQVDDLSMLGIAMFAATKVLPRVAPRELVDEHLDHMRKRPSNHGQPASEYVDAAFTVVDDHRANDTRMRTETHRGSVG